MSVTPKHPNDEVIRAYLDGKVVQYRYDPSNEWVDHSLDRPDIYGRPPGLLHSEGQWRVKPEPRVLYVLFDGDRAMNARHTEAGARRLKQIIHDRDCGRRPPRVINVVRMVEQPE